MGCGSSSDDTYSGSGGGMGKKVKFDNKTAHVINKMSLKRQQAVELYDLFYQIREPSDDLVYRRGYFQLLDLHKSAFSELVFSRFAWRRPDSLTLLEFLCSVWSFLSFPTHMMGAYLFFLFDQDNTGSLSLDSTRSLLGLIRTMHRDMCSPSQADMVNFDRDIENLLHSTEERKKKLGTDMPMAKFVYWSNAHLNLFKSFGMVHTNARKHVMSAKFWDQLMEQRKRKSEMANANYMYLVMMEGNLKKKNINTNSKSQVKSIAVSPMKNNSGKDQEHSQRESYREISHRQQGGITVDTTASNTAESSGRLTPPSSKKGRLKDEKVHKRKNKNKSLEQEERLERSRLKQAANMARRTSRVVSNIMDNFLRDMPVRPATPENMTPTATYF